MIQLEKRVMSPRFYKFYFCSNCFTCIIFYFFITYIQLNGDERLINNTPRSQYHINDKDSSFSYNIQLQGKLYFSKKQVLSFLDKELFRIGDNFSVKNIELLIGKIIEFYIERGFPFVKVKLISVNKNESGQDRLLFSIDSGEFIVYQSVLFKGNSVTKNNILKRETRLKDKSVFKQKDILVAKSYLSKTGLFKKEPESFVLFDKGSKQHFIAFQCLEKKFSFIDGMIGYSKGSTKNHDLWGDFNFELNNILGTMRSFQLEWSRNYNHDEKISLEYTEPWIYEFPIKTSLGFFQKYLKNEYLSRTISLSFDYNYSLNYNIIASYGRKYYYPDSSLHKNSEKLDRFNWGLRYSNIYNINALDEGIELELGLAVLRRYSKLDVFLDKELTFWSKVQKDIYSSKIFFMQKITYKQLFSKEVIIPIYTKYELGGYNSLRGYFENQFNSDIILLSNSEIIFPLNIDTRLFILLDVGGYNFESEKFNNLADLEVLYSGGIGLTIDTKIGNLSVTYAQALKNYEKEAAKIHLKYKNSF